MNEQDIKYKRAVQFTLLTIVGLFALLNSLVAQDNYEIRQISFEGNKTLDKIYLLERMAIKDISFLEKVFTKKQPSLYNQKLMNLDMQRLQKVYQSEGFVDVNARLQSVDINDKKQHVKLTIEINEGQPFIVDTILFTITQSEIQLNIDSIARKNKFRLRRDERFTDDALLDDIETIEDIFRDLGYAYAKAEYNLDARPDSHLVSIQYKISPGKICTVGETTIIGNSKVSENFIRKQLEYKQGETYNKSFLDKTREALYHLQLFRVVSVVPQKDSLTENNSIPIRIQVEETKMFKSEFGVGFGTEDRFRTYLDATYLGFLGAARRLNFYAKHSGLEPYYFSLKWTQPQLFRKKGSISLNPYIGKNTEPGYNTQTYGIDVPADYNFNKRLSSSLTYYFEKVEQSIEEDDPDFPDLEDDKFLYNKSGVLLGTIFTNEAPRFTPTNGFNISVGSKFNGYFFGGDFSYIRLWADFRTYQKLGNWVVAYRIMGGGIYSSDDSGFIPVEDRFYSGGSNSIRGWNRSQLGPKRESGTPLGGKSIFESNVELRYPLFWRLGGVVFFETGNVWEKAFTYRLNNLGYATGVGLRLDTPIGPVRFDVGVPLWNEKKDPQFFLSVGQAF